MPNLKCALLFSVLCLSTSPRLPAQTPNSSPKPEPDVLIFTDGEKMLGHLERATASLVFFKSDMVGEVTVAWTKIQELRSAEKFVAIPKNVKLRKLQDAANLPQGTVAMTDQKLQVNTAAQIPPAPIPIGNVAEVVGQADFENAFHHGGFFGGWQGGATAGLSLTEATQKDQTFTAAVNLVRTDPQGNWLDVRNRTTFDYQEAYGKLTQPGSPTLRTSLYHIDAEQDHYLSPRLFAFGQAVLDHSFSQGLQLQQVYGGGLGFVVFKTTNQELDFKASADYINQQFETAGLNKTLFGSIFGETYVRKFAHGIALNQQGGITPAWNQTSAYSAFASAALTFPVYHRLGVTLGALDDFLNDPPPAFKKNSFQFTLGATYSFQRAQ